MTIRKMLLAACFMLPSICATAQTVAQSDALQEETVRKAIALDYSMPDFTATRIDARLIGSRLAKLLTSLEENSQQNSQQNYYKLRLSFIQGEQLEALKFPEVTKLKVTNITKSGNTISVRARTKLRPNISGIKQAEITFRFVDGVSDSKAVNNMFCDLARYVRE